MPVALASAVKIAREVAAETGLAPARVDGLLALKGVIVADDGTDAAGPGGARRSATPPSWKAWAIAFDRLAKERLREGAKLAPAAVARRSDEIARLVDEAAGLAAAQPAALRERLAAQIKELLDGNVVSEDRLAQEVALLAVKADVREELDRLTAHVQDARALLVARPRAWAASWISWPRNSTARPIRCAPSPPTSR